ncbi:MAG: nitroreductase family protein [Clostridiaceae bacterium]|nr:nitroreductase family protein [Clostridiaceae bacterium]
MDALKVLKERRSIRKYTNQPVSKEIIEDIIDCGRLAATARNEQPWHFVVVTDPERKKYVADVTDYGKFIERAPVCVIVFCNETKYRIEDGSAATENILLAAKAHGLGSCWVAGDKKPYAKLLEEYFGAPEGVKLFSIIAIGYPDEQPSPRKKPLNEVLHYEKF